MAAEAADRLQEVFPEVDRGLLLDVLHQHSNSIEDAITSLLQLTAAGSPGAQGQQPADKAARRRASPAKAPAASRASSGQSWGALGLSADLQSKLRLAPTFSLGGGASAAPQPISTQDFPAALPSHPPHSPANNGSRKHGLQRRQRSPGTAGRPSAWQASPSGPSSTLQAAQQQRQQRQQQQDQWQQEAAEQLALQWPWAGRELVWSVLSSVGFDLDTAQAILTDMAAGQGASSTPAGPAAAFDKAGSTSSSCAAPSGADGEDGWADEQRSSPNEDGWDSSDEEEASHSQRGLSGAEAAAEGGDFVLQGAVHSKKPRGPAAAAAAAAAAGAAAGVGRSQLQQRPALAAAPAEPSRADLLARPGAAALAQPPLAAGEGAAEEWHLAGDSTDSSDDLYYKYRGEALRLTRDWQKMVKKAAAAYSSANHSKARLLAAEAQRLRLESLAAHEAAAARIEEEMNAGNSLFELDLHGLHATEAVAALDRRLELLQSVLQDAALQAQPSQRGGGSGSSGGAAVQQPGPRPQGPLRPACAAALGVLPAGGRWELRVVVGRGAHSSGGEASIPRAVEARLAALGHRFERRTGALDVQLRRAAGLRAAAGLPGQQR